MAQYLLGFEEPLLTSLTVETPLWLRFMHVRAGPDSTRISHSFLRSLTSTAVTGWSNVCIIAVPGEEKL
jgi:hypothetical protein